MRKRNIALTWLVLSLLLISSYSVSAQQPEIRSVDRRVGSMDQLVTLQGSGFGTDPAKVEVFFGATRATIQSISDKLLEVRVPAGTTYDNISVTNTDSNLTGYSDAQFLLSFKGDHGIDLTKFGTQLDFPTGLPVAEGLYDLCTCDFDRDGRTDVATANDNNGAFTFIGVYPNNTSGPGNISLGARFLMNTFSRTLQVKCKDLDGDGWPDLVATQGGTDPNKIFIYKKTPANDFAFTLQPSPDMSGRRVKQIEIADLDLDGRPDIILSMQGSGGVTILRNTSSGGNLSFASPVTVPIPGAVSSDGLAVEDLNGDDLPEIVTAQFQTLTGLYIVENKSTPGTLHFPAIKTLPVNGDVKNIRAADLDGDGRIDLAFTQLTPSTSVKVVLNTSTASTISFGTIKSFIADGTPWGLDIGDLDGDGKPDIVAAAITYGKLPLGDNTKSLTILNNTSTTGNLNFQRHIKNELNYLTRHVNLADMDTDGKPDIVFTSIDDAVGNASKVSIIRNRACMVPELTPPGPLNVCVGFPVELQATKGGGISYQWLDGSTPVSVTGTNVFSPTVTGAYKVRAVSTIDGCAEESLNTVDVTISPGSAVDPDPKYNDPLCKGNSLQLEIDHVDPDAGVTYKWSGPNNFTAIGSIPPPVNNVQVTDAGKYSVDVFASSGCLAKQASVIVTVYDVPDFTITPASSVICAGQTKTLHVQPSPADYTYEWFESTAGDLNITGSSHTVGASGEFYVEATSSVGCPAVTSSTATITVATPPVAKFNVPVTACQGQVFSIENISETHAPASYQWIFNDGTTSSKEIPDPHAYSTAGQKTIKLIVSYENNTCVDEIEKTIEITSAPTVSITNPDNNYALCPEANLVLTTGAFDSYTWSTGETGSSITVTQPGTYTVEVKTSNGCEITATRDIAALPAPVVMVTATPVILEEGQQTQLYAEGLQSYLWEPAESLNNAAIADPVATPLVTTVYTVSGKGTNGCTGMGTIEVKVKGEAIVSKLSPKIYFSPNADAFNPYWVIGEIQNYPQCEVVIYDDKGVKVFDSKPYMNNWDGTFKGKRLPDGVYYYVIRCEGEESNPRMGSVTILR